MWRIERIRQAVSASLLETVSAAAAAADSTGRLDARVYRALAEERLLAPNIPESYGGLELSRRRAAEVLAALNSACTATRSLVTVQSMVAAAVLRMGNEEQRARLLPALASGEQVAAFCLTGSGSGSDASTVDNSVLEKVADGARLSGRKRWVTFGGRASLLLVLAATPGGLQAVLVDTTQAGEAVRRIPRRGQLGLRGCEIADLAFEACPVAGRDILSGPGFGANQVVQTALDVGRFTIACGAWGMVTACLDTVLRDSREHTTLGRPLADYQLVRRHLARLLVLAESGGAACLRAAEAYDGGDRDALYLTILAKLVATTAAAEAASIAVQCTGSRGVAAGMFAERAFRDAKVLEIIEGASEVSELALSTWLLS